MHFVKNLIYDSYVEVMEMNSLMNTLYLNTAMHKFYN